jgi:NAD(P)-dependent dehydrogenase (short-subunit alcohol dehydrogenase family)
MTHQRAVLVTGAAHRLGAEIATAFAQAGWTAVCHYERSQEAVEPSRIPSRLASAPSCLGCAQKYASWIATSIVLEFD